MMNLFDPLSIFAGMPELITNDGDEDILQEYESAESDDIQELSEEDD